MDREKLENFIVLSETLNFSAAAERLFMTQSALSKRIMSLEKELGTQLFSRDKKKIRMTPFAYEFLPYAKAIVSSYEEVDSFLFQHKSEQVNKVVLGSIMHPECYHIDKIFTGFETTYPDIKLDLRDGLIPDLEAMFTSGEVNLYCTCNLSLNKDACFLPIGSGRIVALVLDNDPLSDKEVLTIEDLKVRKLLVPSELEPFYTLIMKMFDQSGVSPSIVYKGSSISSISFVKTGVGIAIMPIEIAKTYVDHSIKLLPVSPVIEYEFGMGYRKETKLSTPEKLFVNYVSQNFVKNSN